MVKRQLTPALAASLAANLTPMTANSTPESFDAVLAKLDALAAAIGRAGINGFGNQVADLRDRLAAAHAAEVGKYKVAWEEFSERTEWVQQTAKPKELGLHRADVLRLRIEQAEARADAAMGLLRETTAVAITMLYDSHKADTLAEFSTAELGLVVAASAPLLAENAQVEHVYRRAWDAATEALAGGERKDG